VVEREKILWSFSQDEQQELEIMMLNLKAIATKTVLKAFSKNLLLFKVFME